MDSDLLTEEEDIENSGDYRELYWEIGEKDTQDLVFSSRITEAASMTVVTGSQQEKDSKNILSIFLDRSFDIEEFGEMWLTFLVAKIWRGEQRKSVW